MAPTLTFRDYETARLLKRWSGEDDSLTVAQLEDLRHGLRIALKEARDQGENEIASKIEIIIGGIETELEARTGDDE